MVWIEILRDGPTQSFAQLWLEKKIKMINISCKKKSEKCGMSLLFSPPEYA